MKPVIFITVPMYNEEKYLRKCIDLLANQTLRDVEFILVVDGSKDSSGGICDEYATHDYRFMVINQTNCESLKARQAASKIVKASIVCDAYD